MNDRLTARLRCGARLIAGKKNPAVKAAILYHGPLRLVKTFEARGTPGKSKSV